MPRTSVYTQISDGQKEKLMKAKEKLEVEKGEDLSDYRFYREMLMLGCQTCLGEQEDDGRNESSVERRRQRASEVSY